MLVRILCSLFKIVCWRVFRTYGDVTITNEELYILDLFCAPMSLEEGGIFIVPHLMRYEAQFLRSYLKNNSFYDKQGVLRTHFNPAHQGASWILWYVSNDESNISCICHYSAYRPNNKTIERSWYMYERYYWRWSIKYKPTLVLKLCYNRAVFTQILIRN